MKRVSGFSIEFAERPLLGSLLVNSLLYRERFAENQEILKHKWIESQKAGYDIGIDRAQVDWRLKYGSRWRKWWRETQRQTFDL